MDWQSTAPQSKSASIAERLGPPVVAFLLARIALIAVASAVHEDALSAKAWSRWDSAHYLSIVERGYEFFSCARLKGYDPSQFCGNTGWLPGLPMLMKLAVALGQDALQSGVFFAALFAFGTLLMLWNGFLGPRLSAKGGATLLLAAFFPGFVYEHALFPISLCAFCHVAALRAYESRRYVLAGLAGAVGAFSYSSGIFLAGVLGLHLLVSGRRRPPARQLADIATVCGLIALGYIAFLILLQLQVGNWRAYFLVQQKYGFGANPPWHTLGPHFSQMLSKTQSLQTCFVVVLVILLLWAALRAPRTEIDGALACYALVYWLIPLVLGGQLSLYRAEAVLLPTAILARKLPLPVLAALAVAAVLIGLAMGRLFFSSVLV